MPERVDASGLDLSRAYWEQVVRPVLEDELPSVPRAAARIGTGSDVLGLDDRMSRDHDWGLRLQLIVPPAQQRAVREVLARRLPTEFAGYPTRLRLTGQPHEELGVAVLTIESLISSHLGFDPRAGAEVPDWLSLTGQAVLEVTGGAVFEDSNGQLTAVRSALAWYPDDVWRYVVASDWRRLDQELPLMGRAGDRGDELGSRVMAARLVDVAMHLGFLLCRRWAPYPKWRGTCFARLPLPAQLGAQLSGALTSLTWQERTEHLGHALDLLADQHRAAGLPCVVPACVPFWDRPYLHVNPALVPAVHESIADPLVRGLPVGLGSIEQRSDNVDLLVHPDRRRWAVGAPALADPRHR